MCAATLIGELVIGEKLQLGSYDIPMGRMVEVWSIIG